MVTILPIIYVLFHSVENLFYGIDAYDLPLYAWRNDSSGITTFTTMMLSIDQIISWLDITWLCYGSMCVLLGVEVLYNVSPCY